MNQSTNRASSTRLEVKELVSQDAISRVKLGLEIDQSVIKSRNIYCLTKLDLAWLIAKISWKMTNGLLQALLHY